MSLRLCVMLFISAFPGWVAAETVSLVRSGLQVTYNEKQWKPVDLAPALSAQPIELLLQDRHTPERQRLVITQLSLQKPPSDLCSNEARKLNQESGSAILSDPPQGWDCLIQKTGKKPQLFAVKVTRQPAAKTTLWSVVSMIEQGPSDRADFKKWIIQTGSVKKGSHRAKASQ